MDNEYIIEALTDEVTQLKTRVALGFMEATQHDKALAEQLFNEQRDEIAILNIELAAVKQSRDEFQDENRKLKRKIVSLEKKLKG
jgi:septal ring factor EnvC (AmiA/AmiB activator)